MTGSTAQPIALEKWTAFMADLCGDDLSANEKTALLSVVNDADINGPMLAATAHYLLSRALPLNIDGIDVCGTGGDKSKNSLKTFNISTAVAFVMAAAGVSVVKHGNRAVSSFSGSSDVLAALHVPVCTTAPEAEAQHAAHNLCFVSAPAFHPALAVLAPIRRALARPTFLNLLGPLCNPARTKKQLMGVFDLRFLPAVAEAAKLLGRTDLMAVHSEDGLDEISLSAPTDIYRLHNGSIDNAKVTPEDFGAVPAPLEKLAGGSSEQNAAIIHAVFSGTPGPLLDVICVNAAAGFVTNGTAPDFKTGMSLARDTVKSGAALRKLKAMKEHTA
ncbi:MAG: anthranilate phosphoribosyltransferase [Micavibrio sp.]|nr:anthranilate phosphoribosyltransferase [Micavibrio sp.]